MTTIAFMPLLLETMRREAEAAFPEEMCGILIGREVAEAHGVWRLIERVTRVPNGAEAGERSHRFAIEPRLLLEADTSAAAQGQSVLGFYHSHPNAEARPSVEDLKLAWPVYSYVILAVRDGRTADIRSWQLDETGTAFHEQTTVDSSTIDAATD